MVYNVKLSDGTTMPSVGFGTASIKMLKEPIVIDEQLIDAIKSATKTGFRHFDGAEGYMTSPEFAIARKGFKDILREEFYVTTKVGPARPAIKDPVGSLRTLLKELDLDYVDLYLIHHPFIQDGEASSLEDVWRAFEEAKDLGLTKSIGVSNFEKPDLERIFAIAKYPPVVNQIEMHPYVYHDSQEIIEYNKAHNIITTCYSSLVPLGPYGYNQVEMQSKPVYKVAKAIAEKHNISEGEVLIKWILQHGWVPITTSRKPERMERLVDLENLVTLSEDEMKQLEDAGKEYPFRWTGWGTYRKTYDGRRGEIPSLEEIMKASLKQASQT